MMDKESTQGNNKPEPSIANLAFTNSIIEGGALSQNLVDNNKPPSNKRTLIVDPKGTFQNLPPQGANLIGAGKPADNKIPQSNPLTTQLKDAPKPPTQPKKLETGGILSKGNVGKPASDESSNIIRNTTLSFGLNAMMEQIERGRQLSTKQIDKIEKNFMLYIHDDKQSTKFESITTQTIQKDAQLKQHRLNILHFPELQSVQVQIKSRAIINQFWICIIEQIRKKLKFISLKACLQFVKLHVRLNKSLYLHQGSFIMSYFTNVELYSIINDKITFNYEHPCYQHILSEVMYLIKGSFRGMTVIFNQMKYLGSENREKYMNVFQNLEKDVGRGSDRAQKKSNLVIHLFKAFMNLTKLTPDQQFERNIFYFQCITEAIWSAYQMMSLQFPQKQTHFMLNFFDQNYVFFNQMNQGKYSSPEMTKFKSNIEKIAISLFLNHPFKVDKWTPSISKLIINSNLEMYGPLKLLLLKGNERVERECFTYELRGIHWKQLVESVIKLNLRDGEIDQFVVNAIASILKDHYQDFWQDPSQFELFMTFTQRLVNSSTRNNAQSKFVLMKILQIGIALMGRSSSEQQQDAFHKSQHSQQSLLIEYPQTLNVPFALKVHTQFAGHFMRVSKKQFLEIITNQLSHNLSNSSQQPTYDDYLSPSTSSVLKEYLLRLITTQPNLLFQLKRFLPKVTMQQILRYLVIQTIQDSREKQSMWELAFAAMDKLLINVETNQFVENLLELRRQEEGENQQVAGRTVVGIFGNPDILVYVANHISTLFNLNYESSLWCQQLFRSFAKISTHSSKNIALLLPYARLLTDILARLNCINFTSEDQVMKIQKLKPFMNFGFVVDFIRDSMRFDFHKHSYVNVMLSQEKKKKAQVLMESVRLFNVILLYQLNFMSTNNVGKNHKNNTLFSTNANQSSFTSKKQPLTEAISFFPTQLLKSLGINDPEYTYQVYSTTVGCTTTYINALCFLLINSTQEQRKLMKQVNSHYEKLIMESIQTLLKINDDTGKHEANQFFKIYKGNQAVFDGLTELRIGGYSHSSNSMKERNADEASYLNKFISYIERTKSETGLQIVIASNLLDNDYPRLRQLIDKVTIQLQRSKNRIKPTLFLKFLSTLSRYLRKSMNKMSLSRPNQPNIVSSGQIQRHFSILLQTIIKQTQHFFASNNLQQLSLINNILDNIYGGFMQVQTFGRDIFVKYMKTYCKVLFNKVNLRYMPLQYQNKKVTDARYMISVEYFNMIMMFLNCQQYMSQKQYKDITNAENQADILLKIENFILTILESDLTQLIDSFRQLLFEIIVACVNFYITENRKNKSINMFLKKVLNLATLNKQPAQNENISTNIILLELLIQNYLNTSYHPESIQFNNPEIWPLQMNSLPDSLPLHQISKLVNALKRQPMNNLLFVSICNGLIRLIKSAESHHIIEEWSRAKLIAEFFSVVKYFSNRHGNSKKKSISSMMGNMSIGMKANASKQEIRAEQQICYKRIWVLELLLAIQTNLQLNQGNQNQGFIEKQFEKFFIQEDYLLVRFGYLMRKLAIHEAEANIPWIQTLKDQIDTIQHSSPQTQITYAEKLQLFQIMKLSNFILSDAWSQQFASSYIQLTQVLTNYRKIFISLPFSTKRILPISQQQINLYSLNLAVSQPQQMISSGLRQMEMEKITGDVLKSTNYFQLMHQLINIQLASQYAMLCIVIPAPGQSTHLSILKKSPILSDITRWNTLYLQICQSLIQKYTPIKTCAKQICLILKYFSQQIYESNYKNISFSSQMLFTNSKSLSCGLDCQYDKVSEIFLSTLGVLFDNVFLNNRKMKDDLRIQEKTHNDRFMAVLKSIKRHEENYFDYGTYDPQEQKAKINHTMRSNISRSIRNTNLNQPASNYMSNESRQRGML